MIYDIILAIIVLLLLNNFVKKNHGMSLWEFMKKWTSGKMDPASLHEIAPDDIKPRFDYQMLFEKFCKVAEKTPLDAFKLARDHMGFGYSDKQVELHLNRYIGTNCSELPNYVEAFLDQGREYIINA